MGISLPCRLSLLRDEDVSVVMLTVRAMHAPLFLTYLDGLKMGRIGKFMLEDQEATVSFAFLEQLEMTAYFPDCSMVVPLRTDEEELLRCCCVDGVLGSYENPHVDFEIGEFDFTFSVL